MNTISYFNNKVLCRALLYDAEFSLSFYSVLSHLILCCYQLYPITERE